MKSNCSRISRAICCALFCALAAAPLFSQKLDTLGWNPDGLRERLIVFATAETPVEFEKLKPKTASFPVAVVPREIFGRMVSLQNRYAGLEAAFNKKSLLQNRLDSLTTLEKNAYTGYIAAQGDQIKMCEQHTATLNASITALSQQLDETRKLALDCNKGRNRKNLWLGVLGGAVGLTLGGLLGAVAAK